MKKKMILAIAALMVMGLAIAAFAYTRANSSSVNAVSCCAGDSCPMKNKNASTGEKASCCDDCSCCSGDSCPMKSKGDASAPAMKMGDAASCPMKSKGEASTAMHMDVKHEMAADDGKGCCCPCCNKETTDAPAV